jgi:hypothetical protein
MVPLRSFPATHPSRDRARISFLDTATFAVQIVNIPGHTTTGHHWLSANGKFTFVAVENPAGLVVVDNETGAVAADYPYPNPPGGTRAHGVFYQPRLLSGDDEEAEFCPTVRSSAATTYASLSGNVGIYVG